MAREPFDIFVDCDHPDLRRGFANGILGKRGIWRFRGEPKADTRTLRQNSFYFAAIVTPLYEFCRENHIEGINCKDDAHEMLKREVLKVDVVNPRTGAVMGSTTGSTRRLTIEQKSRYIEDCRDWILERTGIDTLKYVDEGSAAQRRKQTQQTAAHAAERIA